MLLPDLMALPKMIVSFGGWSEPDETDYVWFNAPVDVAGITDLLLHGGCYRHLPDRHVVFELRGFTPLSPTKRKALERFEWRSLRGGHSSPRRKGVEGSGRRVGDTHVHPFELNWVEAEARMRSGNLRQAAPVDEELQSFESVRSYVGNRLKINNIDVVSMPPWAYEFLY